MTTAILLSVCLVLAGCVFALAVAVRRLSARVEELVGRAGSETGAGAPSSASPAPTEEVAQQLSPYPAEPAEFVITRFGEPAPEPAPTLEAKLFADVVLRESVVKAASWAYGVRRGLSPANRNRIWFEMRREVRRARKERKAEEREAIREWRARRRAAVRLEAQEESAA